MYTNASHDELIIFTTNQPTNTRLYTLAHNPAYRNAMTFKGYMQSHHPDTSERAWPSRLGPTSPARGQFVKIIPRSGSPCRAR
ncbi:hypothetical protein ACFYYD_11900 [Streptomyces bluensis]|uniref:hypothetical protein n=1 Tax=Streptomyces bluensis TaxID=33897 RepID=UPI003682F59F